MDYLINNDQGFEIGKCSPNETILNTLMRSKIYPNFSCKMGKCGYFKLKLISGSVYYLNKPIGLKSLDKKNYILPCISKPSTNISIEY
jgi:ferredoxin